MALSEYKRRISREYLAGLDQKNHDTFNGCELRNNVFKYKTGNKMRRSTEWITSTFSEIPDDQKQKKKQID